MLMDEPFGALDPITRDRLQNELLRLHREVGKTVIFVTHDIDEAIKMGDRIAILREGGVLAQYDTPDAILAAPGRRLRRRVRRRRPRAQAPLAHAGSTSSRSSRSTARAGLRSQASTTLRDALSLMLSEGSRVVVVVDGDGAPRGSITLDALAERLES